MKKAMVQAAVIMAAGTMGVVAVTQPAVAPRVVQAAGKTAVKVLVRMHDATDRETVVCTKEAAGVLENGRVTFTKVALAEWQADPAYQQRKLGPVVSAINNWVARNTVKDTQSDCYVADLYALPQSLKDVRIVMIDMVADSQKVLKEDFIGSGVTPPTGYDYEKIGEPGIGFVYQNGRIEIPVRPLGTVTTTPVKQTGNDVKQSGGTAKSEQQDTAASTTTTVPTPPTRGLHDVVSAVTTFQGYRARFDQLQEFAQQQVRAAEQAHTAQRDHDLFLQDVVAMMVQKQALKKARVQTLIAAFERRLLAIERDWTVQKARADELTMILARQAMWEHFVAVVGRAQEQQLRQRLEAQQQQIQQQQAATAQMKMRLTTAYQDLLRIQAGVAALHEQAAVQAATTIDATPLTPAQQVDRVKRAALQPAKPAATTRTNATKAGTTRDTATTPRRQTLPAQQVTRLTLAGVVKVGRSGGVVLDAKQQPTTRSLTPGTRWRCFGIVTRGGQIYYDLGGGQYLLAGAGQLKLTDAATQAKQPVTFSGVVTIDYVPGYGVQLWRGDGTMARDDQGRLRKLAHGSRWHAFGLAVRGGHLYYALGGDQYVDAAFGTLG